MSNLIGSQLNQVPTNSDLGDLAFQNATSLKQITANAVTGKDIYLQSLGTGSTPTLNLNFYSMDLVRNNYIDSLITFQRNTTATVWKYDSNNQPVLATVGVDVPRYEIDPVTGDIKGLLIEEQRTNLFLYSEDISQWSQPGLTPTITVSNTVASPSGTYSARLLVYPTGTFGTNISYRTFAGAINTTYCGSIYLRAAGYTKARVSFGNSSFNDTTTGCDVDLPTGTITATYNNSICNISNAGNGWYRVSVTATSDSDGGSYVFAVTTLSSTGAPSFTPDGTSGMYYWGAQVEVGAYPTSYIPTTTAAVTRNADFISFPTSSFYSSSGGTLVLDATTGPSVVSRTFVALNNAGANEQIGIRCTTGGGFQMFNDTSAVTSGDPGTGTKGALPTIPVNTRFKAAFVFGTNDFRGSVNGTSVRSDTSGALATGITTMNIGSRNNSTSENCSAHIGSIQYYTAKFSDAILQELSA